MHKAADLTSKNNYQLADKFYQSAWEKYNLLDDSKGKAAALLGRIKCCLQTGNRTTADSLTSLLDDYTHADNALLPYAVECKISRAYADRKPSALTFLPEIDKLAEGSRKLELKSLAYATYFLVSYESGAASDSGNVNQAKALLTNSLLPSGKPENDEAQALLAYALGMQASGSNDFNSAREYAAKAFSLDEEIGNTKGMADDSYLLGVTEFHANNYETAADHFLNANELYKGIKDDGMADRCRIMELLSKYKLSGSIILRDELEKFRSSENSEEIQAIFNKYFPAR